jgi:hypothetical protein
MEDQVCTWSSITTRKKLGECGNRTKTYGKLLADVTSVLISICDHHWRWAQREDFLRRDQAYSGLMLVKQLKATVEKVAVLGHILLHPLAVLQRFIMNSVRVAPDSYYMNNHINARIEEQVSLIRNLHLPRSGCGPALAQSTIAHSIWNNWLPALCSANYTVIYTHS